MKQRVILALTLALLFLTACSSDKNEEQTAPTEKEDTKVTIEGVNGEVTLDAPAKKIVALEWTYAENLLAVGVQPVGVADIEMYESYVNIEPQLDESVTDVGLRQEPSLEVIASLEPDLIIGVSFRHEGLLEELNSIAPTVVFNPYPDDESIDVYGEMETTFKEVAKAVGKESEAEVVLADLEQKYEEAKGEIDAADLESKDVLLTLAYSGAQAPEIRVFTPNSLASKILERIGLNNVHESEQFEIYGYSTYNVEGLVKYEEANYLYSVQDDDNIYENQLKDNQVWKNLDFVQENRLYDLGEDTWLYGGPLSAATLLDQIVEAMVHNE
ncbi:iron complex transport system substrate-binding protein [Evansella caseinilytica]|uniref:Iron complex transport system substrate-binding protein n=1 Tax=Evansella caseinilytica TaxID=1503961 RepID=A0A1H3UHP0_9BACI|nr:iron-siderophore ABC transporter substrate-binding protein [Evansella caseinilytica]SDZ61817.1 iron complex transport system substrate-binding protein [Evansella caseinilytica]